ncbi:non-structural maintenance of chromosomes element 1 homolog [Diadema setosum]|uniref:non-structural maintenance of chromosomes element 1 homolog n=1 Tax=Diadema setosum TaxID=31175 RepID=UPI003B3B4055
MLQQEHKLLVQTLLAQGLLTEEEMEGIYTEIKERCNVTNAVPLAQFKDTINTQLNKVSMEIKHTRDDDTGTPMYALVMLWTDLATDYSHHYQPQQIEYFKKVVNAIVTSERGVVSSTDLLNLVDECERPMSKTDTQDTLQRLMEDKWLNERDGEIWLSSRTIMEQETYLRETYDCVDECEFCKQIAIKCQICSQCGIKRHSYCAERFTRPQERVCRRCNLPWE